MAPPPRQPPPSAGHLSRRRCRNCGGALSIHQEVRGQLCDDPRCQRAALRAVPQQRALAHRDEVAASLGLVTPEALPFIIVPTAILELGTLPERRRRRFRDHLNHELHLACVPSFSSQTDDYPAPITVTDHQASVLSQACGVCRGNCCMTGRNQAWLYAPRLRAILRETGLRPIQLFERYLDLLPRRHCQGSCVYHGPGGCLLPRDLRGTVCNAFYCPGLLALYQLMTSTAAPRALIVSMDGFFVVRSDIVELHES